MYTDKFSPPSNNKSNNITKVEIKLLVVLKNINNNFKIKNKVKSSKEKGLKN